VHQVGQAGVDLIEAFCFHDVGSGALKNGKL
jgi:hypothetical protein